MIVRIHPDSHITLDDADTFTAFSVQAPAELGSHQIAAAFGMDAQARDEDHVWIFAKSRFQGIVEFQCVDPDFTMPDQRFAALVHKLHRIFNGEYVTSLIAIDPINHCRQGGAFA